MCSESAPFNLNLFMSISLVPYTSIWLIKRPETVSWKFVTYVKRSIFWRNFMDFVLDLATEDATKRFIPINSIDYCKTNWPNELKIFKFMATDFNILLTLIKGLNKWECKFYLCIHFLHCEKWKCICEKIYILKKFCGFF